MSKQLIPLTVGGVDYASRLKSLLHVQRPYGGIATLVLTNHDRGITADLRGKKVVLGYGFVGLGSTTSPSLWVKNIRDVSVPGTIAVQLDCIDVWLKLSLTRIKAGGGVELKGTTVGAFQPGMKVTGQSSAAVGTVMAVGDGYIAVGRVAKGPFTTEDVQADIDSSITITVSSVANYGGGSPPGYAGDKTILQIIQELCSGIVDVVLDNSDGIVDVTKPYYNTEVNVRISDVVMDLMNYTKCAIRAGSDDKLHIFSVATAPGSPDHTYDTLHNFYTAIRDTSIILPNTIMVYNAEQVVTGMDAFAGLAQDVAAAARFIEVTHIVNADVLSDEAADELAASMLHRIQMEATRGELEAPMNCSQELFDYIRVIDDRTGIDYYGWVGSITRRWEPGYYRITLGLGGLTGAEKIPVEDEYPLPNLPEPIVPGTRIPIHIPRRIPTAIQGFHHDVTFTSEDYDTVSWSEGTIKFYDGTEQAISSGSVDLADTDIRYIYFDLAHASPNVLKITTDYLSVLTINTGVICIVQKGSADDITATVIPSFGKEPLITPDIIYMTGLLNYDYGGGQKLQKILSTEIQAGYLKLHAGTIKDGEWYNEGGVIIDAIEGIIIDAVGTAALKIYGADRALWYDDDDVLRGFIQGSDIWTGEFYVAAAANTKLFLSGPDGIVLVSSGGVFTLSGDTVPGTDDAYDLGASDLRFVDGYIRNAYHDNRLKIPVGENMYD